jgi:hypothetical protein
MIRVTTRQYSMGEYETTVHDIDAVRMGLDLVLYDADEEIVAMFSRWYSAQKIEQVVIRNLMGETLIREPLEEAA